MERYAILIGVQDYGFKSLTAPAKDARDMRNALVSHGIFTRDETLVLADDGSGNDVDGPASRERILAALRPFFDGQECSRLFFYFSGHGASWRVSSGASVLKPVLLCHGVNTFGDDGGAMIDVEELLERFRMRGPDEQIWVIDACRNIPDNEERPVVPPTTWADRSPIAPRRRALVYAVAPLAQAAAIQGENSVFTREFLEGLGGKGRAAVYDAATDAWVVSHRSICEYARARLEPGMAEWEKAFKLPRIEFESDPPPGPLRQLPAESAPKARSVSLKIDPALAAGLVSAQLKREGATSARWPPHIPSPELPPAVYRFEAQLAVDPAWDRLVPATAIVDTREADEIAITVSPASTPIFKATLPARAGATEELPTHGLVEIRSRKRGKRAGVRIETAEPTVRFMATLHGSASIPVDLLARPEWVSSGLRRIDADLSPGLWRIEARLAEELLGTIDVDLGPGMVVDLRLVASMPEALRDARWTQGAQIEPSEARPTLIVAERMGPIQGAVLSSVLPLLALKAFDARVLPNLVTRGLSSRPPRPDETAAGVAVALDGDWTGVPSPSLSSATLKFVDDNAHESRLVGDDSQLAVLTAVHRASLPSGEQQGLNRAFLRVPGWGSLDVALPRVPNRIACVGVTLRAGGAFELSIASLSASSDDPFYRSRSETARAVAIGARLLGTGTNDEQTVRDAAYGKWLDPILGALAWQAINAQGDQRHGLETIARNMFAAFPSLVDSIVLLHWLVGRRVRPLPLGYPPLGELLRQSLLSGTAFHETALILEHLHHTLNAELPRQARRPAREIWRPRDFRPVFGDQPVLAASIDAIADMAAEADVMNHWAVRRRSLIEPGAVWNAVYLPETVGSENG